MQLRGAVASHVGNVRDNNQDRAHFGGYIAAVADGMGGHQGGEMAASIAIKEFLEVADPIGPGGLVEIVEEANRAVFERAADPDLRGMGTTLVALTLRPEEGTISIVNVGDSRAYFLRNDEFKQLTLDHSLVEDLVRQNRLTPEEALTHPQRNILTRALGIASEVEVDRFLHQAELGDRFLLCSDGLFNEVTEDEITRILMESEEPNAAADTLVSAALSGAARDNVTVAVIDVVADGQGGNVSTNPPETIQVPIVPSVGDDTIEAERPLGEVDEYGEVEEVASGQDFDGEDVDFGEGADAQSRGEPIMQSAGLTQAGAAAAGVDLAEAELAVADEQAYNEGLGSVDTIELPTTEPSQRGSRLRRILFGLVILVVLGGAGYYAANSYATNKWFVAPTSEGKLAIYNGRPDNFLWIFKPELVQEEDIVLEDLMEDAKVQVSKKELFDSVEQAKEFIKKLEVKPAGVDALEQIEPSDEETDTETSTGSTIAETTTSTQPSITSTTVGVPTTTTTG